MKCHHAKNGVGKGAVKLGYILPPTPSSTKWLWSSLRLIRRMVLTIIICGKNFVFVEVAISQDPDPNSMLSCWVVYDYTHSLER